MNLIESIITEGLLIDIIKTERALKLSKSISANWTVLNKSKKDISNIIFQLGYTEMVLSINRLYDNSSSKYPTRCIKKLYKIIEETEYCMPIMERDMPIYQLSLLGSDYYNFLNSLKTCSDYYFNKRMVEHFRFCENNEPLSKIIKHVRNIRDKLLAHNEDITIDESIKFTDIEVLLDHAKNVISFFAFTYSGLYLMSNGKFESFINIPSWKDKYENFINEDF